MPRNTGREWLSERKCTECGRGSWDRAVVSVAGENRGGRCGGSDDAVVDGGSWWCVWVI